MTAHVHILLATFNGARYLNEQLHSFARQTHKNWTLWASDDGSSDKTRKILQKFAKKWPVNLIEGPKNGATQNFMHLLNHPDIAGGYVALSDQDDVWLPHRLTRAIERLENIARPALYCSRTIITDEALKPLGASPKFSGGCLQNAIVQNISAGNTIALNPLGLDIIRKAGRPDKIQHHDWWIYLLIAATEGEIVIDHKPGLFYRQHANNSFGAHQGISAIVKRLGQIKNGEYRQWILENLNALQRVDHMISDDARPLVHALLQSDNWETAFKSHGVHRKGMIGQFMLNLALRLRWL